MIYQLIIRGTAIEKVVERMLSSVITNGNAKMNGTIVPYMYYLVNIATNVTQQSAKSIVDITSPD